MADKLVANSVDKCGWSGGRTLTDEISRQKWIGPICWTKVGWE